MRLPCLFLLFFTLGFTSSAHASAPDCPANCQKFMGQAINEENDPCGHYRTGKTSKTCSWALREGTKDACMQLCTGKTRRELSTKAPKTCHMTRQAIPKPLVYKSCIKGYSSAFDLVRGVEDHEVHRLLGLEVVVEEEEEKEEKEEKQAKDADESGHPGVVPIPILPPHVAAEASPKEKEVPSSTFFSQMEHLIHDMIDPTGGGIPAAAAPAHDSNKSKKEQHQDLPSQADAEIMEENPPAVPVSTPPLQQYLRKAEDEEENEEQGEKSEVKEAGFEDDSSEDASASQEEEEKKEKDEKVEKKLQSFHETFQDQDPGTAFVYSGSSSASSSVTA